MGEVEQRACPLRRHEAHRRLRRVALGVEHDHRAALPAQVLGDGRHEVAGLALLDRARHGGVLLAQLRVDRDRPERVAQRARVRRGAAGSRAAPARAAAPLARREPSCSRSTAAARGRPARSRRTPPCGRTAADCPRPAAPGGRRGRAGRGARPCRARPDGSPRPRRAARRRFARRPCDSGAITRRSTKNSGLCWTSRPPRSSASSTIERSRTSRCSLRSRDRRASWRLYRVLGETLEERRRGRHRQLHERRLAARAHDGHQPVHRRLAIVLETVEDLDPLDELGVLLQPQHRRRRAEPAAAGASDGSSGRPSAVRPRPSPQAPRGQVTASHTDGESRSMARVMVHLERHGRLTQQQSPPPAAQQALVQRLEHRHDRLGAGPVGAVGLDPQTHVATSTPGPPARERDERSQREHERDEQPRRGTRRYRARRRPGSRPSRGVLRAIAVRTPGRSRRVTRERLRSTGALVAAPSSGGRAMMIRAALLPVPRRETMRSARSPPATASRPSSRHSRKRSTSPSAPTGSRHGTVKGRERLARRTRSRATM